MALHVSISDPEGLDCFMRVKGSYNPDTLDDLKTRVVAMYKEALGFRQSLLPDDVKEPASE